MDEQGESADAAASGVGTNGHRPGCLVCNGLGCEFCPAIAPAGRTKCAHCLDRGYVIVYPAREEIWENVHWPERCGRCEAGTTATLPAPDAPETATARWVAF